MGLDEGSRQDLGWPAALTLYRPKKPRVRTVDMTTSLAVCPVVDSCWTVLVNSICAEKC